MKLKIYTLKFLNALKTCETSVFRHSNTRSTVVHVVCSEIIHRGSVKCLSKSNLRNVFKVSKHWSIRVVALIGTGLENDSTDTLKFQTLSRSDTHFRLASTTRNPKRTTNGIVASHNFYLKRVLLLHRHHAERCSNLRDQKNSILVKKFENTATESGCF